VIRTFEGGVVSLEVRGEVCEASALGPFLCVERTIRTSSGSGCVEIVDVTTNLGRSEEVAPILYHVNLGYPVVDEGARVEIDTQSVIPRDSESADGVEHWQSPGKPILRAHELVFEHVVAASPVTGWANARLLNATLGIEVTVSWDTGSLPRFHEWLHRRAGVYVVAFEPANCSVLGRAHDREEGRLPLLAPGESRTTRIRIEAKGLSR
jgi:hypothetical protein